jgi:hypothetical protein
VSEGRARNRPLAAFWLLAIIALLVLGLRSAGLRELFTEAVAKVNPAAVVATIPGQVLSVALCAGALYALRPGVSYWACVASRLLRDAGDNLLVFLPGLGDLIGARALVLAGGSSRPAIMASTLDKIAELTAQLPFIALAGFVLLRGWEGDAPNTPTQMPSATVLAWLIAGIAALSLVGWMLTRAKQGPAARLTGRIGQELRLLTSEFRSRRAALPAATSLHFLGWVLSGVQVWMAGRALGLDIGLYEAIALESAAYAGRTLLFFVPAGLVAQEAGLAAAGLVFGLTAPQSLALALVLRLRDVVFGLSLLLWPIHEYRHGRKVRDLQ